MSDYKDMGRSRLISEIEALSHWRDLALQFDNHRMEALWHLKRVITDENQNVQAEIFLSKPPLSAGEIVAERDQLKAENAGLKTGYQAYERVNAELKAEVKKIDYDRKACWAEFKVQGRYIDQLKDENDALRKDADKWQIVERAMTQLQSDEHGAAIWSACSRILISVASELNSVRSVVTEEGVTNGGVEIGDWRVTVERIDTAMAQGEQS